MHKSTYTNVFWFVYNVYSCTDIYMFIYTHALRLAGLGVHVSSSSESMNAIILAQVELNQNSIHCFSFPTHPTLRADLPWRRLPRLGCLQGGATRRVLTPLSIGMGDRAGSSLGWPGSFDQRLTLVWGYVHVT